MPSESVKHEISDRDPAVARVRLRRSEEHGTVGQEHELLLDVERPAEEIDVGEGEAKRLPLSEAGTGTENQERTVAEGSTASRSTSTWSTAMGETRGFSILGRRTSTHGDFMMRPSRTAIRKMEDT